MSNLIDTIKKKHIIKPRTEVLINALPDFRHTQNTVLNTDVSSPDYGKWQCIASEQADSTMNGTYYTRGSHYYNNDYGDGHYISNGIDVGDGNAAGSIRSFFRIGPQDISGGFLSKTHSNNYAKNGTYTGSTSTIIGGTNVLGEYIIISAPYAFVLNSYGIVTGHRGNNIYSFKIGGSNDGGQTWATVDVKTEIEVVSSAYSSNLPNNSSAYSSYILVVTANSDVTSTGGDVSAANIDSWYLYKKTVFKPTTEWILLRFRGADHLAGDYYYNGNFLGLIKVTPGAEYAYDFGGTADGYDMYGNQVGSVQASFSTGTVQIQLASTVNNFTSTWFNTSFSGDGIVPLLWDEHTSYPVLPGCKAGTINITEYSSWPLDVFNAVPSYGTFFLRAFINQPFVTSPYGDSVFITPSFNATLINSTGGLVGSVELIDGDNQMAFLKDIDNTYNIFIYIRDRNSNNILIKSIRNLRTATFSVVSVEWKNGLAYFSLSPAYPTRYNLIVGSTTYNAAMNANNKFVYDLTDLVLGLTNFEPIFCTFYPQDGTNVNFDYNLTVPTFVKTACLFNNISYSNLTTIFDTMFSLLTDSQHTEGVVPNINAIVNSHYNSQLAHFSLTTPIYYIQPNNYSVHITIVESVPQGMYFAFPIRYNTNIGTTMNTTLHESVPATFSPEMFYRSQTTGSSDVFNVVWYNTHTVTYSFKNNNGRLNLIVTYSNLPNSFSTTGSVTTTNVTTTNVTTTNVTTTNVTTSANTTIPVNQDLKVGDLFTMGLYQYRLVGFGSFPVFLYESPAPCLLKGTRVLTTTGYRLIESISLSDSIINHEMKPVQVLKISKRVILWSESPSLDKEVYKIDGPEPIFITSWHKVRLADGTFKEVMDCDFPLAKREEICDENGFFEIYHIHVTDWVNNHLVVNGGQVVESWSGV